MTQRVGFHQTGDGLRMQQRQHLPLIKFSGRRVMRHSGTRAGGTLQLKITQGGLAVEYALL
ncbi:hypothetical protein D3C80_2104630 [compost metagenome]